MTRVVAGVHVYRLYLQIQGQDGQEDPKIAPKNEKTLTFNERWIKYLYSKAAIRPLSFGYILFFYTKICGRTGDLNMYKRLGF
jgi:hypothetical protein